jgi:hypothetical protein
MAKQERVSLKGTVLIGPLGVRKLPDLTLRTYKVIPRNAELKITKVFEPTPGLKFGKIATEQWVLISNGPRTFIVISE